ncbi:hypothetical protein FIA58_007140 [Flavobacterium jejuense]|uniref:TonB-dependent receptor SusC n=1 Tax=Flavobacterium jejuense TaxID=1544455 RepID=A0ABX0INR3_9FLAO|nr:carboxypeptidase-like regulatory domain-containing protein [Flavobacterium jejuense]NHN25447.1 hypothetical protein [Flavobacterium jejuense]
MNQKTTLSINTPCSEKFDNFLSTEKGGFCSSCQKEVTDFINWTDKEVANHFKNTTQNTCGYFREEQLKTYDNDSTSLKTNRYKLFNAGLASVSLLSLLYFNTSFGQTKTKPTTIQTETKNKERQLENQSEGIIVKGIISDEIGPLAGANVALKNSNIGVTTNFNGEFTFPQPLKEGTILLVSYVGFTTQEVKVTNETNHITLKMDDAMLCFVGEVSVAKVYQSKLSFVQRVKSWFKNE